MANRAQLYRLKTLAFLVVLAFAGLGYRLVDVQVVQHERLKTQAEKNTRAKFLLEPRRGDILDVNGHPLAATSYDKLKTVCANPDLISSNYLAFARVLAPILELSEAKLAQKLMPRAAITDEGLVLTNTPTQWVMLKKRVPVETWEQVRSAVTNLSLAPTGRRLTSAEKRYFRALKEKAVFERNEPLRVYPNAELAAHVLGYTLPEERKIGNEAVSELVGCEGIESTFNTQLAGVRGWCLTGIGNSEGKRREQVWLRQQTVEAKDGYNVVLTVDSVVQQALETALGEAMKKHTPLGACGVVIRPKTGAVMAMATMPTYNPAEPKDSGRNRVISDRIEPGSTFKIVPVSAALSEKLVKLSDSIDCENGSFWYGGRALHDHERYKSLTVEEIIEKSSNIGAAKIGIKLGEERLYDFIKRFGFGTLTGIPLTGEVPGAVYPVNKWSKVTIAQLPMGHGLTVTPLQMALAMCAIANQGVLMRPMVVDRIEDRDGNIIAKYEPQKVHRVVSEESARQLVQALKTVVSKNGTAPKAALDHYTVAGKTGTAQKVEHGRYASRYFSSFIGFFPADDPELCIAITLDEPKNGYYGGQVAGPVFKQVAERAARYMGIRPDKDPEEGALSPLASAEEAVGSRPQAEAR